MVTLRLKVAVAEYTAGFTVLSSTSANISKWKQTVRTSLGDEIQELKSKIKLQAERFGL